MVTLGFRGTGNVPGIYDFDRNEKLLDKVQPEPIRKILNVNSPAGLPEIPGLNAPALTPEGEVAAPDPTSPFGTGPVHVSTSPFDVDGPVGPDTGFGTVSDFGQMFMTGMINTFGLPLDIVTGMVNMVNGTDFAAPAEMMGHDLSKIGLTAEPGKEPQTFMGRTGRALGETTAAMAVGVPPGVSLARKGARLGTLGQGGIGKRLFERMGSEVIQRPGRFVALETAAGAGAGGAGYIASQRFPNSVPAQVIGELLGGLVTMTPLQVTSAVKGGAWRAAKKGAKRVWMPFTKKGGRTLAGRRLMELSGESPELIISRLNEEEVIPGILSPAQLTGQPRHLAVARAVLDSSPELERYGLDQVSEANKLIHEQVAHFAGEGGAPNTGDFVSFLADTRIYLKNLIQMRSAKAAARADIKIGKAAPHAQTAEEASEIVREELDTALLQMRADETKLHMAVPKDEVIEPNILLSGFDEIMEATPKAQQGDIPAIARSLLWRKVDYETGELLPARIGEFTTSNELIGLRTKMLEEARAARKKGLYNRARIANEIAGLALDELNTVESVSAPFLAARTYSNELNDQFTKGPVGRILGYDGAGSLTTSTGLTVERMLSRGGQRAKESYEAVIEAVDASGPKVRGAVTEFLRNQVLDADGVVDVKKVNRLLEKQSALLDRFPHLRNEFREVIKDHLKAGDVVKRGQKLAKDLADPRLSAVGSILGADPGKELNKIMDQRDKVKLMRDLNKRTRGVPQARKGLKLLLIEHMVGKAKSGFTDELGERLIDGAALNLGVNKDIKVLREVFTNNEITRLRKISNTAHRLLKAVDVKNLPDVGGISVDTPNKIVDALVRTLGARMGAKAAQGTTGASILTAHFGAERAKALLKNVTKTEAEKLVTEAVLDGELFKALFMEATSEVAGDEAVDIIQRKLFDFFAEPVEGVGGLVKQGAEAVSARAIPVTAGVPLQTALRAGFEDEE
tara:strand:+ start:9095 stop:12001 length:2907 start_codon:yes stop_codon:yes gene_type:complete